MATFAVPDSFKEHPKYIPLLKKALLMVKPGTEKKFVYFKQFPFGKKKFPLVMVDFDAGCVAALAKDGFKPTDEGLVSLTAQDELNFTGKKGNLKRVSLKKYFATMGTGIKPVFVPPGETDDEDESEAEETTETGEKKRGADENEVKRGQLLARIKELQAKSFPPKIEALKKQVLEKAKSLGDANKFPEAMQLLDQLGGKAAAPAGQASATAPLSPLWGAARKSWQTATETVDAQLTALKAALKKSGDADLAQIAESGLDGVLGAFKEQLIDSVHEIDSAPPETRKALAEKARTIISGFETHVDSEKLITACENNPFKVTITIRSTLKPALAQLDAALAGV
jgi:hypothetical protein